jgi:hypothetical protein
MSQSNSAEIVPSLVSSQEILPPSSSPSPPGIPVIPVAPIALVASTASDSEAHVWQQRAQHAERELVVRQALGAVDWFDVDDAYRTLAPQAFLRKDENSERSEWVIESKTQGDKEGQAPRYLSLSEAVKELATAKSHWVRARVLSGSGAGSGTSSGARSVTYADLLKAENFEKLREYVHQRPDELERLRQSHFKR